MNDILNITVDDTLDQGTCAKKCTATLLKTRRNEKNFRM